LIRPYYDALGDADGLLLIDALGELLAEPEILALGELLIDAEGEDTGVVVTFPISL
jgi:hypothetical protein